MTQANQRRRDEHVLGQAPVLLVAKGDPLRTAVAVAAAAEEAGAAGQDGAEGDLLPRPKALHTLAQGGDDAHGLVTGDHAGAGLLLALVDADVGVADTGGPHLKEHVAWAGVRLRALLHAHIAGAVEDAGLHHKLGTHSGPLLDGGTGVTVRRRGDAAGYFLGFLPRSALAGAFFSSFFSFALPPRAGLASALAVAAAAAASEARAVLYLCIRRALRRAAVMGGRSPLW